MRKNSNAVNSSDDLIEDSYAIIDQDLADMANRLKKITTKEEYDGLTAEVGQARLRMIAVARAKGGLTFARLMRPFDELIHGENITVMRRRRR